MESRFFERIAKTYRKEQWDVVLRPLLSIWYSCAQQTGNMELSVQLLLEMLGHGEPQDSIPPSCLSIRLPQGQVRVLMTLKTLRRHYTESLTY